MRLLVLSQIIKVLISFIFFLIRKMSPPSSQVPQHLRSPGRHSDDSHVLPKREDFMESPNDHDSIPAIRDTKPSTEAGREALIFERSRKQNIYSMSRIRIHTGTLLLYINPNPSLLPPLTRGRTVWVQPQLRYSLARRPESAYLPEHQSLNLEHEGHILLLPPSPK